MKIIGKIALDEAQVEELLCSSWTIRLATLGPGEHINLTALWFSWDNRRAPGSQPGPSTDGSP